MEFVLWEEGRERGRRCTSSKIELHTEKKRRRISPSSSLEV
jgi:hypothetical protein